MKHVLQWHILHRCNLRCTHCYQEDYAAELTGDQLERIFFQYLGFCRKYGYKGHINFTGGEPLLSPELFRLLGLCEENGITYGILTNGTLIDESLAERLGGLKNLSFVQVSIDGTKETHDRVRGKGSFDKAFEGLRLIKKAGIQTMAAFTCHKGNYTELRQVIKIVRREDIDRFWADRLIPMGSSREEVLSTEEYRSVIKQLTKEHFRRPLFTHTDVHLNRSLQFLEGGECYYHCSAGVNLLTLLADGTLLPCRRLPIPIGNCLEEDMTELYENSPLIKELREMKIPEDCYRCPQAERCRGGAKCLSYAIKGVYDIKDINCYNRY
ncbi:MAG: radical SAM protein [Ruminococcus sp.]|nr:radical SAM protein [Ruminococcus sp.]